MADIPAPAPLIVHPFRSCCDGEGTLVFSVSVVESCMSYILYQIRNRDSGRSVSVSSHSVSPLLVLVILVMLVMLVMVVVYKRVWQWIIVRIFLW